MRRRSRVEAQNKLVPQVNEGAAAGREQYNEDEAMDTYQKRYSRNPGPPPSGVPMDHFLSSMVEAYKVGATFQGGRE